MFIMWIIFIYTNTFYLTMEDCIRYFETEQDAINAFDTNNGEGIKKPFLGTIGTAIINNVGFDNIDFEYQLFFWEEDGEYFCGPEEYMPEQNDELLTFGETPLE